MNCPKCEVAMTPITYAGIEVDRCPQCDGLWFDALEAERLREIPGSESIDPSQRHSTPAPAGPIKCPVCQAQMIEMVVHRQPHIHFEGCTVCGGWFLDAGEFKDMKEFTVAEWLKSLLPPKS